MVGLNLIAGSLVALIAAPGADPTSGPCAAGGASESYAIHCGRLLTMDAADRIFDPGLILVRDGRIVHAGEPRPVPEGYVELDLPRAWAGPGLIDIHTHIHTGGWGDINDMVLPVNPELRTSPTIVPSNPAIRRACAAGVTTLFGIPGSGTSIGGFGVLYKTKTRATYDEAVVADPGGMKVAQTHNPERYAGDLGSTRAGLYWLLQDINDKALAAERQGRFDPALANLQRVLTGELPALIHCAGGHGVASTVRLWKGEYDTRCIVSHGSFDGWKVAAYAAAMGVPVNHGPRTMDWRSSREGRFVSSGAIYAESGGPDFSLNTDSGVIAQEEFFLQGAMVARLNGDSYQMLRALTIHPARAFGVADRVGSLEPGKDADIVLWTGDPLDPRSAVQLVLIDGSIQYDKDKDGQWF